MSEVGARVMDDGPVSVVSMRAQQDLLAAVTRRQSVLVIACGYGNEFVGSARYTLDAACKLLLLK